MSRDYRVWATVSDLAIGEVSAVESALEDVWPFEDGERSEARFPGNRIQLSVRSDGTLNGGESFMNLARRLSMAMWREVGRYVLVQVIGCEIYATEAVLCGQGLFNEALDNGMLDGECLDCGEKIPFHVDKCAACIAELERANGG